MPSPHTSSADQAGRGTVLASLFAAVLDACVAAGLERARLLQATGVDEAELANPESRVPQPAYLRLWEIVETDLVDPFFGLRFAEAQVEATTFSAVGFAARSSRTFGEALERVARYSRVINEAEQITITHERFFVAIGQNPRGAARPWPRHKTDSAMANYVVLGRRWTGKDWAPSEVCFRHAEPADTSAHRKLFRCPLRFEQPRNELRLAPGLLALPLVSAAPDLEAYLGRRAEQLLSTMSERSLLGDIRVRVREALPGGRPELAIVARRLGQSPRSLQRKLAEAGTSFAQLVDEVRRELALELVGDRRLALEEVACVLGFADARGFRRAFERWTGRSPREFRGER